MDTADNWNLLEQSSERDCITQWKIDVIGDVTANVCLYGVVVIILMGIVLLWFGLARSSGRFSDGKHSALVWACTESWSCVCWKPFVQFS